MEITLINSSTAKMSILFAIVLGTSILANHEGAEARSIAFDCHHKSSERHNLLQMDVNEGPTMTSSASPKDPVASLDSFSANKQLLMKAGAPSIPAAASEPYKYRVPVPPEPYADGPYTGMAGPYADGPYTAVPGPYTSVNGET